MVLVFVLLRSQTKRPFLEQNLSAADKLLHIDWVATILFTFGGVLLLLGLNWGSNEEWNSAKVIISLILGVVLIGATLGWEAILEHKQSSVRTQEPDNIELGGENMVERDMFSAHAHLAALFRASALLPLNVLGNYDVLATSVAAFTSGMVMLVNFYFVALFLVIVSGKSATNAGVQLIYFAPGMVCTVALSPKTLLI